MIANGRFSKAAFEGVYRALPVVDKYGHTKDTGPNPKEIAIVEENITRPTKEAIRKKFENSKGKNLLSNRWTTTHTQILEGLVMEALDGTGMNAGEVLYLNVDGSCLLNAIVPVQGDSIASSAVHLADGGAQTTQPRPLDEDMARDVLRSAEVLCPLRLLPVGKEAKWTKQDADFLSHAREQGLQISYVENPKSRGSASRLPYHRYSRATILLEALELGATTKDI